MFRVAKVCKHIIYECGCVCRYEIIANFAAMKKWNIAPCCEHHKEIARMEMESENDWMTIVREMLSEHDCIAYLQEKGYTIHS